MHTRGVWGLMGETVDLSSWHVFRDVACQAASMHTLCHALYAGCSAQSVPGRCLPSSVPEQVFRDVACQAASLHTLCHALYAGCSAQSLKGRCLPSSFHARRDCLDDMLMLCQCSWYANTMLVLMQALLLMLARRSSVASCLPSIQSFVFNVDIMRCDER